MFQITKPQKRLLKDPKILFSVLTKYKLVILASLFIGLVIALPHLYGLARFGGSYEPLRINSNLQYTWDETYLYAAQVHQYRDGLFRGDTYLLEYQDKPSPFLGEIASILPIVTLSLLTGSVKNAFIVSDIIFPAILFLIIFITAKKVTKNEFFSTLSGITVVFAPNLSSILPFFSKGNTTLTGSFYDPLLLSRTPHPQVSLIYLFIFSLITYNLLVKPTKKTSVLWAIATGISLYSSIFVASTIALTTIMLLPLILRRISSRLVFQCLAIVFLISTPYLINYVTTLDLVRNTDFLDRTTYPVHILFPRQLRYLIFALLLVLLSKKNYLPKIILAIVLAASITSDGHQLILGKNIDADHWINRVIAPLSTFSILLIFTNLIKTRNYRLITLAVAVIILFIGIFKQISWISQNAASFKIDPSLANLTDQINKNTNKDDVIGSEDYKINQNITGLTGRKSYLGPADRVLADYDERERRACDLIALSSDKNKQIAKNLTEYSVGLLIWNKMSSDEKEKVISKMSSCQSPDKFSNKYKIDYFVLKNSDNTYSLTLIHQIL